MGHRLVTIERRERFFNRGDLPRDKSTLRSEVRTRSVNQRFCRTVDIQDRPSQSIAR